MAFAALWILVPPCTFAWPAVDQYILPAITIDVGSKLQEDVRIGFRIVGLGIVDLLPFLKVRPCIPERTGNDVRLAVFVDVGDGPALRVKFIVELLRFPCQISDRRQCDGSGDSGEWKQERGFHGAN